MFLQKFATLNKFDLSLSLSLSENRDQMISAIRRIARNQDATRKSKHSLSHRAGIIVPTLSSKDITGQDIGILGLALSGRSGIEGEARAPCDGFRKIPSEHRCIYIRSARYRIAASEIPGPDAISSRGCPPLKDDLERWSGQTVTLAKGSIEFSFPVRDGGRAIREDGR